MERESSAPVLVLIGGGAWMPFSRGVHVSLNSVVKSCPSAGGFHVNTSEEFPRERRVKSSMG